VKYSSLKKEKRGEEVGSERIIEFHLGYLL
jgi:hypothetical protein